MRVTDTRSQFTAVWLNFARAAAQVIAPVRRRSHPRPPQRVEGLAAAEVAASTPVRPRLTVLGVDACTRQTNRVRRTPGQGVSLRRHRSDQADSRAEISQPCPRTFCLPV